MKQPPLKGAIGSESVAAMEPHELISYMIIYSPFKEMYTNLSNMWDAKIEEKNMRQWKTITQDNIYVIRQFAYVYGVAKILLFSKKYYKLH